MANGMKKNRQAACASAKGNAPSPVSDKIAQDSNLDSLDPAKGRVVRDQMSAAGENCRRSMYSVGRLEVLEGPESDRSPEYLVGHR